MKKQLLMAVMAATTLMTSGALAHQCDFYTGAQKVACMTYNASSSSDSCSQATEPCPYSEYANCHTNSECYVIGENRAKEAMYASCVQIQQALQATCEAVGRVIDLPR